MYAYDSVLCVLFYFFFFKQKTAYELRISDWSSDVCSSDLGNHANADAVLGLRTAVKILDEQLAPTGKCRHEIGLECGELRGRHRLVGGAPPDRLGGFGIADGELVVRRAAGVPPRRNDKRAIGGEMPLAAYHRRLDQQRG